MSSLIRPNIRAMTGYVPGEQPRDGEVLKLNTNENPYPPSPRVFEAIRAALTDNQLRKYPDPMGSQFRRAAGRVLGVDPDGILIGNGSDDVLTIATRALVGEGGSMVSLTPSYVLYRTLAEIQGARFETVPFAEDWRLPSPWPVRGAALTLLANPNSPSGSQVPIAELERWVDEVEGLVLLDEAYADFAPENGLSLARRDDVLVTRSLSKAYSLAGIRFGFAVGTPQMIHELAKVKDSYNCDVLSLAAATAAIEDQAYLAETRRRILATRDRLTIELERLGFAVTPSHANFVWARRSDRPVRPLHEELRNRQVLVRYMQYAGHGDGLRVSVGTDAEIERFLATLAAIL